MLFNKHRRVLTVTGAYEHSEVCLTPCFLKFSNSVLPTVANLCSRTCGGGTDSYRGGCD